MEILFNVTNRLPVASISRFIASLKDNWFGMDDVVAGGMIASKATLYYIGLDP